MALVKLTILNLKKVQKDTSPYIEIKLSISALENIKNAQLSLGKKEEDIFLTLSKVDYYEVISPNNPVIIEQVIPFPQGATYFIFNYLTSLDKKETITQAIIEKHSLLPNNATPFEHLLALTCAKISDLSEAIISPFDLANTPKATLPWLAWLFCTENWDPCLSTEAQRNLIQNSIKIHKKKGTRKSLELALRKIGDHIDIKEWWELGKANLSDRRHYFIVYLEITKDKYYSAEDHIKTRKIIDRLKPATTFYDLFLKIKLKQTISVVLIGFIMQKLTLKVDAV